MSKEVARWADPAMFRAEPIKASDGPKVYLLWMTPDPLGAIAAACKMYKGEVVRDLSSVTDAERTEYFDQVQNTKLQAPFEFVQFHFMIEGVTRAFTHQMVRQRTACYAQESLRFAVKEDLAESVALPPSLAGTEDANQPWLQASDDQRKLRTWNAALDQVGSAYQSLIDSGMPAEDARGLLPHNVTTRLHYNTNLRALLDHAGNRLCTQAQFEWRAVFARIIEAIRGATSWNVEKLQPHPEIGTNMIGYPVHMREELSKIFRPVCFQTGKCEFKANFDRACKIRERVDAFQKHGIPSESWGFSFCTGVGEIPAINSVEWLADPGAAR